MAEDFDRDSAPDREPAWTQSLGERLLAVRQRVAAACQRVGRMPDAVTLIAVSKGHPPEAVAAAAALSQVHFGENYAQELQRKAHIPGLRWHFIGHLQRNKIRQVVGTAALIHTVDSEALIHSLAARARDLRAGVAGFTQECLVEVNLQGEAQKGGCAPAELPRLLAAFSAAGGALACAGLMCIPPAEEDSAPHFRHLRALRDEAAAVQRPHVDLRHLSMGMSHDFEAAIAEGATLVRVGTAIFGPRPPKAAASAL